MNLSIERKIEGINNISNGLEGQMIAYGDKLLLIENETIHIIEDSPIWYGEKFQEYFLYQFNNGENLYYVDLRNKSKGHIKTKDTYLFKNIVVNNNLYIRSKPYNLILDPELKLQETEDEERLPKIIFNNYFIRFSYFIELYDPDNGNSLWKIDFKDLLKNEYARSDGRVQIIGEKLLFFLYDETRQTNTHKTFCLDAETGEVLFETDNFGGWLTKFDDKIYTIGGFNIVQVLNPISFDVERIDLKDCLSVLDKEIYNEEDNGFIDKRTFFLSSSNFQIKDNFLFFTQERGNVFGIINLETKELLSNVELEIKNKNRQTIGEIRVDDKRVYVTDSDHILTVFNLT